MVVPLVFGTHDLIYRHAKNLEFPIENQGVLKSDFRYIRLSNWILKYLAALERREVGKSWASINIEKNILWVYPESLFLYQEAIKNIFGSQRHHPHSRQTLITILSKPTRHWLHQVASLWNTDKITSPQTSATTDTGTRSTFAIKFALISMAETITLWIRPVLFFFSCSPSSSSFPSTKAVPQGRT